MAIAYSCLCHCEERSDVAISYLCLCMALPLETAAYPRGITIEFWAKRPISFLRQINSVFTAFAFMRSDRFKTHIKTRLFQLLGKSGIMPS